MTEKERVETKKLHIPRWTAPLGVLFSLLGIADTIYLTIGHYTEHFSFACPTTSFVNCESVTTSSYSQILGIPVAVLGLTFFVAMLAFQLPQIWKLHSKLVLYARLAFSVSGIVVALWLIFVEFQKLHEICLYCTASHILAFGIFVVTSISTALIVQSE